MRRKFLSVLLAMAMVLTLAPVTALAAIPSAELTGTLSGLTYAAANDGNATANLTLTVADFASDATLAETDGIVFSLQKGEGAVAATDKITVPANTALASGACTATATLNYAGLDAGSYKATVTVKVGDGSTSATSATPLAFTIGKADQSAPTGLTSEAAATEGGKGKIKGTTTAMQYKVSTAADNTYADCTDTATEVDPGTYVVRFKMDDNHNAGTPTSAITVGNYQGGGENPADVAAPTFSPAAGAVTSGTKVTISSTTAGATIKYTTDGTEPDANKGTEYNTSDKVTITGTVGAKVTVKAIAIKDTDSSAVATAVYTITAGENPAQVAKPTISPNGGSFTGTQQVTITAADGAKVLYSADATRVEDIEDKYATESTVTFTLDATATVRAQAVKNGIRSAVAEATFTKGGGGSGSGSSGGSSNNNNTNNDSSVKVPVSGDDHGVDVSADVSGSTATIDKIEGLDKVLDSKADTGVVEIDLTALKKDIDTVKLPAAALEDIAKAAADDDNDVDGLSVKLDSGTIEFDADALEAIADQASGSTIDLKLEKAKSSDLNSKQKDAVKDMDIHGHFDLTMKGGKAITDFKGGKVSVKIPFSVPSGKDAANFVVIFVADDGTVEEMKTSCSGGYISFTTDHFSKYLIAYKEAEPVEPEPVPETPVTTECDGGANCPAGKFTDVNTDLWYHKAIDYVLTNGLMSGVGDGTFAPNANLSRAMLAQILYNQEGRPAASADSVFDDVAAGMWYTNAIAWAAENGVVSGLGDGKFGPNNNITREQLAVMLYRYAGSPSAAGGGSLDRFADADKASGYAKDALVWATGMGIMSGKGGGMLDPQGQATRAEVAQMLYNYLDM